MKVLDSDTIIFFFRNKLEVVQQFTQHNPDNLAITIINQAELLFGAYHSEQVSKRIKEVQDFLQNIQILPFEAAAVDTFAQLKSQLQKQGTPIADMDLMIASICLVNEATLVTNNTSHFERIEGLSLENWVD